MGMEYIAEDWRLFIDGSVNSLKAHITNKKPAVPVAYSTQLKESWNTLYDILQAIKYEDHKWKICSDLKVVNMLQGLKMGFPKYFCYLCCWNTRNKDVDHYTHQWDSRTLNEKTANLGLIEEPMIENPEDILLPPLHLKLGILKKFLAIVVKNNDEIFKCLKTIFPKLSNGKILAGFNLSICTFSTFSTFFHIAFNFFIYLFYFKQVP